MRTVLIFALLLLNVISFPVNSQQPGSSVPSNSLPSVTPTGEPILYVEGAMGSQLQQLLFKVGESHKFINRLRARATLSPDGAIILDTMDKSSLDTLNQYITDLTGLCQTFDLWVISKDSRFKGRKVHFVYTNSFQTLNLGWLMPKEIGNRESNELFNPISLEDDNFEPHVWSSD